MKLNLKWNNILLVWNWGHKNMWDELILIWNIKLLLQENKKIYIACSNKDWLKNCHKQFLINLESKIENWKFKSHPELVSGSSLEWQILNPEWQNKTLNLEINELWFFDKNSWEQTITYLTEWPKWVRSTFRFLKDISNLKKYFQVDSILIGWWEIFTEETPWSYWYWFFSIWLLLPFKNLYLSGGIQIPKKIWNKISFWIMTKKAIKLLVRDFDLQNTNFTPKYLKEKTVFFPDTSIFVPLWDKKFNIDLINYKWNYKNKETKKIIVININKRAENFYDEIHKIADKYYRQNYEIYFAWICKSPKDSDIKYYHKMKKDFQSLKLLDRENRDNFIEILSKAEEVYSTRLHLFLISYYLNLKVIPFAYQKKVNKMKEVLNNG